MELPVDCQEEGYLILIDFLSSKPGNLAPSSRGVVAVLEILGCQDQGSQKHTTPTLQNSAGVNVIWLLHSEVVLGDMRLDKHKII